MTEQPGTRTGRCFVIEAKCSGCDGARPVVEDNRRPEGRKEAIHTALTELRKKGWRVVIKTGKVVCNKETGLAVENKPRVRRK